MPTDPQDTSIPKRITDHPRFQRVLSVSGSQQSQHMPTLSKFFQFRFIDYLYSEVYESMSEEDKKNKFTNKKILLYAQEAGNFGDISHVYFLAKLIRKKRPEVDIAILIQLETKTREEISAIFPVSQYHTQFIARNVDFRETAITMKNYAQTHALIGVAVSFAGGAFYGTHHRFFYEYGFFKPYEFLGKGITQHFEEFYMGLSKFEAGIHIPEMPKRQLEDLQSNWLKHALSLDSNTKYQGKLFNLYMRDWMMQLLGVHTIVMSQVLNDRRIDIVVPPELPCLEIIKRHEPLLQNLKEHGIGVIKIFSSNEECVILPLMDHGKELRFIRGSFVKQDMETIQQYSQPFSGSTGDMSFSEGVVLNKIPFYEALQHKSGFFDSLITLATELNLTILAGFLRKIAYIRVQEEKICNKHKRKQTGGFWQGSETAEELAEKAKKAEPELVEMIFESAKALTQCIENTQLMNEVTLFNHAIATNYNIASKIIASVDRGLFLLSDPSLFKKEKELWESFKKNEMSFENIVLSFQNRLLKGEQSAAPDLSQR